MSLSEAEKHHIVEIIESIQDIADKIIEPVDPKIEGALELAFAMLVEQLNEDRRYEWGEMPAKDDKFLFLDESKDSALPSSEELESWLPKEWPGLNGDEGSETQGGE